MNTTLIVLIIAAVLGAISLIATIIFWIWFWTYVIGLINSGLKHREEERARRDKYFGELILAIKDKDSNFHQKIVDDKLKENMELLKKIRLIEINGKKLRKNESDGNYYLDDPFNEQLIKNEIIKLGINPSICLGLKFKNIDEDLKIKWTNHFRVFYEDQDQGFIILVNFYN